MKPRQYRYSQSLARSFCERLQEGGKRKKKKKTRLDTKARSGGLLRSHGASGKMGGYEKQPARMYISVDVARHPHRILCLRTELFTFLFPACPFYSPSRPLPRSFIVDQHTAAARRGISSFASVTTLQDLFARETQDTCPRIKVTLPYREYWNLKGRNSAKFFNIFYDHTRRWESGENLRISKGMNVGYPTYI